MFFLRDGMNDPLSLENSFGNLGRVPPLFNEEKIQEQTREACCKGDEFEGIGVTNFEFLEEIFDVFWP